MKTKTPEEAIALLDAGIAGAEYLHAEIRRLEAENARQKRALQDILAVEGMTFAECEDAEAIMAAARRGLGLAALARNGRSEGCA